MSVWGASGTDTESNLSNLIYSFFLSYEYVLFSRARGLSYVPGASLVTAALSLASAVSRASAAKPAMSSRAAASFSVFGVADFVATAACFVTMDDASVVVVRVTLLLVESTRAITPVLYV